MESAFTFVPRYLSEGAEGWDDAFSEQISRIGAEINVASANYRDSEADVDKENLEDCNRWLTATVRAQLLYQRGMEVENIAVALQDEGRTDFTGSESLISALANDDFAAMIDW